MLRIKRDKTLHLLPEKDVTEILKEITECDSFEEIPVSSPNSNTSQICYIALSKDKAIKALKEQAIPTKTIAYEYMDEVVTKTGEVKLAIEIEISYMLDLTHKPDYEEYIKSKINGTPINNNISLIRKVVMNTETNQFKVVYIILNNSCIKRVHKITNL